MNIILQKNFAGYLLLINIVTFFTYGIDKQKAQKHKWRIPENTLLGLAVLGGSLGAFAGMYGFRHKTKHLKFVIGIPLIILIQLGVMYLL